MISFKRVSTCICGFAFLAAGIAAWGQTTPPPPQAQVVYVATGGNQVYAVTPDGTPTALIPTVDASAEFTSLTVGPDNVAGDNAVTSDGSYNFFLYACDSYNGNIVRIELNTAAPGAAPTSSGIVTIDAGYPGLVCGRAGSNVTVTGTKSTSPYVTTTTSGNFYFASGTDVYEIADASSKANDGSFPVSGPVITSEAGSIASITQKNIGDMLAVDPSGKILRAAYLGSASTPPFAATFTSYIADAGDLTGSQGIARAQAIEQSNPGQVINDFFVVNGGEDAVFGFDPSSSTTTPFCSYSFKGNQSPTSIAASEDNYLYVGVNSNSWHAWGVQILDPGCQGSTFISLSALKSLNLSRTGPVAVAVPPVSATATLSTPVGSSSPYADYNFGSSLLQVAPGGCNLTTVNQTPMPLSFLQSLTDGATVSSTVSSQEGATWLGGAPAPGNGERGFGTVYTVEGTPKSCDLATTQTNLSISGFFDPAVTNPRIIHCEDNFTGCEIISASGNWPTGGYLPNDITIGGNVKGLGSKYFLVNGNLVGTAEQGTFCGFENPLTTGVTYDAATGQFSGPLAVFNPGQGVSVKFKLGADGTCSGGNFVTDASALLSVAQIQNGQGESVFVPMTINTQGTSTSNPPIFKFNSNSQNYQFSLNLTGYAPGIYALSVTFLTNNAPVQVTYFQVQ